MNQKSRQQSKNSIEKDFYKLMNYSNFGYDCRNNLDNCKLVPIFDEFKEISYINRYHNIFGPKVSEFFTSELLRADVEEKYNARLSKLDEEDRFYEIKLQTIKAERLKDLEAAEKVDQQNKKNKKITKLIEFIDRKNEALTNQKVKSLIDFAEEYTSSIKSVAIEKSSKINLTTQFLNGKMLMLSKFCIKSFVYDLIDDLCFQIKKFKKFTNNIKLTGVIYIKT